MSCLRLFLTYSLSPSSHMPAFLLIFRAMWESSQSCKHIMLPYCPGPCHSVWNILPLHSQLNEHLLRLFPHWPYKAGFSLLLSYHQALQYLLTFEITINMLGYLFISVSPIRQWPPHVQEWYPFSSQLLPPSIIFCTMPRWTEGIRQAAIEQMDERKVLSVGDFVLGTSQTLEGFVSDNEESAQF